MGLCETGHFSELTLCPEVSVHLSGSSHTFVLPRFQTKHAMSRFARLSAAVKGWPTSLTWPAVYLACSAVQYQMYGSAVKSVQESHASALKKTQSDYDQAAVTLKTNYEASSAEKDKQVGDAVATIQQLAKTINNDHVRGECGLCVRLPWPQESSSQ